MTREDASEARRLTATDEWWKSFFDDTYAKAALVPRDPGPAERAADRLVAWLGVAPGDLLLDQCCGVGRIALPLAARGMRLVGVDQSEAYVELARAAAARQHADARFFVGDAFAWTPPETCDAGFNWFTSFGYHPDDAMNLRMLQAAHRAIRPGGRFVLEYISTPGVLRRFRSSSVHRPEGAGAEGLIILDEPTIDFRAGMVVATWTFLHADGRRDERRVMTRLFMPHELVRLFEQAGFRVVDLLDGDTGDPLELGSRRMAVVGER